MKAFLNIFIQTVSYFFILLFIYACISKLLDFENFQVQLAQSPLVSAYAGFISYAVIAAELIIVFLLISKRFRLTGLYLSLGIMLSFAVYIYLILNYSDFVPCSCGGILEKMSWSQHLVFNMICVLLALISVIVTETKSKSLQIAVKILGLSILSTGIVIFLFLTSEHIMKKENNFIRRFPHHVIREDQTYDLKVNSYYFAGASGDTIYLGNTTSPFLLTKIDHHLKNTRTTFLEPEKDLKFRAPKITVVGHSFYLYDGYVPVIFRGEVEDSKGKAKTVSYQYAYFDQIRPIDNNRFVVRTQSSKDKSNILGILSLHPFQNLEINKDALQKQKDGVFDTDGQLLVDYFEQKIYYFYYYQSKIIKFDYNLKILGEQKTIDHFVSNIPQIHTLTNGTRKIGVPSLPANQNMMAYKGMILSQSNLMGKFENPSLWKKNNIIDVYNMNTNEYWGSFYIPNPQREKVHQMLIHRNYLYVLIGRKIVKYRIAQTLLDQFEQGKPKT